jgi:multisubunit Na+/H+ antiporter MnhB subunit
MLLLILGLALIIVLTVFAYKTAKDYERNAVVWALITFAVVFGIQIVLPIVIFILIAIAMTVSGSRPEQIQEDIPEITITIICLVLSLVAGMLILRRLSKIPDEPSFTQPPKPPEHFN